MGRSWKEHSRINWETTGEPEGHSCSDERLKIGCLQRIADATEAMAKSYTALRSHADWLEEDRKRLQATIERLSHSNAALRGHLKRIKKQA